MMWQIEGKKSQMNGFKIANQSVIRLKNMSSGLYLSIRRYSEQEIKDWGLRGGGSQKTIDKINSDQSTSSKNKLFGDYLAMQSGLALSSTPSLANSKYSQDMSSPLGKFSEDRIDTNPTKFKLNHENLLKVYLVENINQHSSQSEYLNQHQFFRLYHSLTSSYFQYDDVHPQIDFQLQKIASLTKG